MMSRTIFIGDIHGCFDEFLDLLSKINFQPNSDKIYLTGDLVHKGPASHLVIDYVIQHKFKMVLGNHDDFFLRTLLGEQKPYDEFLTIIGKAKTAESDIKKWFLNVPLFYKEAGFILVHAGLDPKAMWLSDTNKKGMLNIRFWETQEEKPIFSTGHEGVSKTWVPWYECIGSLILENHKIFYGHYAKKEVQIHRFGKIIGLDTGCCYGGALSAFIFEEDKLVLVPSKQKKQFDY